MLKRRVPCSLLLIVLMFAICLFAQTSSPTNSRTLQAASLPHLIRFSGKIEGASGTVAVTFALYAQEAGGAPLWLETQNVVADANGRFTMLLGANHAEGVPVDLFANGEARWLGMQREGQPEQQRVLLVSVPYALKAGDADTLGGKPLSAFLLAPTERSTGIADGGTYVNTAGVTAAAYTISGTSGALAMFTSSSDLASANVFQSGGNIGFGTPTPQRALHIKSSAPVIKLEDTAFPNGWWELQQSAFANENFGFLRYEVPGGAMESKSFVISKDGNMGVGVGVPVRKLHLKSAGQTVIRLEDTNYPNSFWELQDAAFCDDCFGFLRYENGVSVASKSLLITNAGNFGIGTAYPITKLDVSGVVRAADGVRFGDGTVQTTAAATSLTPADGSIAISGTASARTLAVAPNGITNTHVADGALSPSKIAGGALVAGGPGVVQTITGTLNVASSGTAAAGNFIGANASSIVTVTQNGAPSPTVIDINAVPPAAISATATAPTGHAVGLVGRTSSDVGAGVLGINDSMATPNWDLPDENFVGVMGISAQNIGVMGLGHGKYGMGLFGYADYSGTDASNVGVYGVNLAPIGPGIEGVSMATTGSSGVGVTGISQGDAGFGVRAVASSTTGFTAGVFGKSNSPDGVGGVFVNTGGGNIIIGKNNPAVSTPLFRVDNLGNVFTPAMNLTTAAGITFADGTHLTSAVGGVSGGGTITGVNPAPGSGLTGGGTSGSVSLGTDSAVLQKRVTSNCPGGAITQINQDGSVNCVTITTGTTTGGGTGPMFITATYRGSDDINQDRAPAPYKFVADQPITVTRVKVDQIPGSGLNCGAAVLKLSTDAVGENIAIPNVSEVDTGSHELPVAAGATLVMQPVQGWTCSAPPNSNYYSNWEPVDTKVVITYRPGATGDALSCPAGTTACGANVCANTAYDPNNCGGCGIVCPSANHTVGVCMNGTCTAGACGGTYMDCDHNAANGCETNTAIDTNNCGYCGAVCPLGPGAINNGTGTGCANSQCQFTCNSGWATCPNTMAGPCATNVTTDVNNCGACGHTCGGGQACVNSQCISSTQSFVIVSPSSVALPAGTTYQFTATINNLATTAVTWSVQEATGGTVSATGSYTAPAATGTYHVVATPMSGGIAGTATVTVGGNTAPVPPVFTSTPPSAADEGATYSYALTTNDPNTTYRLVTGPNGAYVSGNLLEWYVQPRTCTTCPGQGREAWTFNVQATASNGGTATQTWTVTPTGTIWGYAKTTYLASQPPVTVPLQPAGGAWVISADGTSKTSLNNFTANPDGSFKLSQVPAGPYWLWVQGFTRVVTDASLVDFSTTNYERVDSVKPTQASTVTVNVTGGSQFQPNDSPYIWTTTTDCWAYQTPVAPGATSWSGSFNLFDMGGYSCALLNGTEDTTYYADMVDTVAANNNHVLVAKKVSAPLHPTLTDGGNVSLDVPLTDVVPNSSVRFSFRGSTFPAALAAMNPSATFVQNYVDVMALPTVDANSATGDLVLYPVGGTNQPITTDMDLGDVSYANPFPGTTTVLGYGVWGTVSYTAPGATTPYTMYSVQASYSITDQLPTANQPAVPVVTPVTGAQIGGQDVFASPTIGTLTPLITWNPPAVGSATAYQVGLFRLGVDGSGNTTWTNVGSFWTKNTSLRVPSGPLTPGSTIVVKILAQHNAGSDITRTPGKFSLPYGNANLFSSPITISSSAMTGTVTPATAAQVSTATSDTATATAAETADSTADPFAVRKFRRR